jgi:deazaflavin-dependent oxidoreductase (nitroreductase family)
MSAALAAVSGVAVRAPHMTRRATAAHGALLRRVRLGVLRRWFGMPLLVLETVGCRSGERRTVTLAFLPDGDDLVVVPANAGAARAPAWWLNLRAAGAGVVDVGTHRMRVTAHEAEGEERQRLWRRIAAFAPIDRYQRRTDRLLPVVVLRPS